MILNDTGPLVAMVVPTDQHYNISQAAEVTSRLQRREFSILQWLRTAARSWAAGAEQLLK